MSKSQTKSASLRTIVFGLLCVGVAAAAPMACGSDETEGSGGSGATSSSGATDNTGGVGNTGNTSSGASGNTGGGSGTNVDCPESAEGDACLECVQMNCMAEVTACCDQDAMASPDFGCYDIINCARENECTEQACVLDACGDVVNPDAIPTATALGDCINGLLDAGTCPECGGTGGAGGGG